MDPEDTRSGHHCGGAVWHVRSNGILCGGNGKSWPAIQSAYLGVQVGETAGGLLGPILGWMVIAPFFNDGPGRRSWAIRKMRPWIGLFVSFGLANTGVLWLLLSEECQGVEVPRLELGRPFSEAVFSVALSPDNRLALSAEAGALPLWKERPRHCRAAPFFNSRVFGERRSLRRNKLEVAEFSRANDQTVGPGQWPGTAPIRCEARHPLFRHFSGRKALPRARK